MASRNEKLVLCTVAAAGLVAVYGVVWEATASQAQGAVPLLSGPTARSEEPEPVDISSAPEANANNIGVGLASAGELDQAIQSFQYALQQDPDYLDRVTERKRHDTNAQGTLLEHSKSYYDEMGRVYESEIVNPGDTETASTNSYYSKGGKLKKSTDPYSKSTTYAYPCLGQVGSVC
jgi:hypothetical protein